MNKAEKLTPDVIENLAVEIREFLLEHEMWIDVDHILSMSFEGIVCEMLYYGERPETRKKLDAIIERYGLYYEFGNHWNFSCYYI